MKTRTRLMFICTIILVFLVVPSNSTPKQSKLNVKNWGPQSMMYLKGKYGRRYVNDYEENNTYRLGLNSWYTVLKGLKNVKPVEIRKIRRLLTAENVVFRYL